MQTIVITVSISLEWKSSTFTKCVEIKTINLLKTNKIKLTTNIFALIGKCQI
jgi:hypothetical protein